LARPAGFEPATFGSGGHTLHVQATDSTALDIPAMILRHDGSHLSFRFLFRNR
jgi:hypothetical protein